MPSTQHLVAKGFATHWCRSSLCVRGWLPYEVPLFFFCRSSWQEGQTATMWQSLPLVTRCFDIFC